MSNNSTPERPAAPRPVFETLPKACAAAIAHENTLSTISVPHWARTFGCSEEQVKDAWEKALWIATQKPVGFEEGSEGK